MCKPKQIPYVIKTNGSLSLFLNEEGVTVNQDHPNYNKIVEILKSGNHQGIEDLINLAKAVTDYIGTRSVGNLKVVIRDGQIFYGEYPIHNSLTTRIISMMSEGFKFDHMIRFLENLLANPSSRSVNETYRFLENYGLPITDDGHFLAYKAVRNNYMDIHSGKISNKIGESPSMPRCQVDETYERDCSTGLHCGALDYVVEYGHFKKGQEPSTNGNRLLIVKVNPANVVSVPKYEKHPKIRVCTYTVISEIKDIVKELDKAVYSGTTATEVKPDHVKPNTEGKNPSDDYACGFFDGDRDRYHEVEYGATRQYDGGNYLKGYNDAFNRRNYVDPSKPLPTSDDYDSGFNAGLHDRHNNKKYGKSRLNDDGNYLTGYNAAFNGRDYNVDPADKPKPEKSECCCGQCDDDFACMDIDQAKEDEDFSSGFLAGRSDFEEGRDFEASMSCCESDAFRIGYRDGWDSAAGE